MKHVHYQSSQREQSITKHCCLQPAEQWMEGLPCEENENRGALLVSTAAIQHPVGGSELARAALVSEAWEKLDSKGAGTNALNWERKKKLIPLKALA